MTMSIVHKTYNSGFPLELFAVKAEKAIEIDGEYGVISGNDFFVIGTVE